jgi:hypothetical protein
MTSARSGFLVPIGQRVFDRLIESAQHLSGDCCASAALPPLPARSSSRGQCDNADHRVDPEAERGVVDAAWIVSRDSAGYWRIAIIAVLAMFHIRAPRI